MKKLSGLILVILVAIILMALNHGIGFGKSPVKQAAKVPVCHNPRNWHPILVDEHAVPALLAQGDFIIDESHPCPPDVGNYSPAPTPTQVPPGPAPNPVPTDTPENWLEVYLPVIYGNNLY